MKNPRQRIAYWIAPWLKPAVSANYSTATYFSGGQAQTWVNSKPPTTSSAARY